MPVNTVLRQVPSSNKRVLPPCPSPTLHILVTCLKSNGDNALASEGTEVLNIAY